MRLEELVGVELEPGGLDLVVQVGELFDERLTARLVAGRQRAQFLLQLAGLARLALHVVAVRLQLSFQTLQPVLLRRQRRPDDPQTHRQSLKNLTQNLDEPKRSDSISGVILIMVLFLVSQYGEHGIFSSLGEFRF